MADTEELTNEGEQSSKVETEETEENEAEVAGLSNVDERGVPWKNVAEEARRKAEEANERLARIEEQLLQSRNIQHPAINQQTEQISSEVTASTKRDPKAIIEEFANDPEGFLERRDKAKEAEKIKINHKLKLQEATIWLNKQDPANYTKNEREVLNVINEYGIRTDDPVRSVQSAWRIIEEHKNASMSQREKEDARKKEEEKKRVEEINKKQTGGGTKAPAPKPKKTEEYRNKAIESGSEADVAEWVKQHFFPAG